MSAGSDQVDIVLRIPDKGWPDDRRGFADVGLRLAFTAPDLSLAAQLRRMLDRQPYVFETSRRKGATSGNPLNREAEAGR